MHRHISISAAIALLGVSLLSAQGRDARVLLGPTGGFGIGSQFGSVPVYAGSGDCGVFSSGSIHGPWAGARLLMPGLFSNRFGFSAMGSWQSLNGSLTALPVDKQLATDPITGGLVTLDRSYALTTTSSVLQADLLADYRLGRRWHVAAGPWIGYQLSFESSQIDSIGGPGGSAFAGGERSRVMTEGIAFTPAGLSYGLLATVGIELPVGAHVALLPEASLRATLSSPATEAWWGRLVAGAGLSLLFDLHRGQDSAGAEPPVGPARHLAASIRIDGVDPQGVRQHIASVELSTVSYRTFTPLVPAVFFDANSAAIADRYSGDTSSAVIAPETDTLGTAAALDVHHHTLAIIGSRMAGDGSATLTLYGSGSSDEREAIAASRAQTVKDYLAAHWKIDPARIAIAGSAGPIKRSGEASEDGRVENRRVEFSSNTPSILAPVVSTRMAREFNPPSITVVPTMNAEAGVKRWAIDVKQGGEKVSHYSSEQNGVDAADMAWKIADVETGALPSPIGVDLTVEDSAGATVTAHDEMPIVMQRRDKVLDHTVNSLVGFEYNSPEPAEADMALLNEIAATIEPGSRVMITGYTDRIGTEEYNTELSRRRAERVGAILKDILARRSTADVEIGAEAGGVETGRYGNDFPEGRMLSRGVRLVVTKGQ